MNILLRDILIELIKAKRARIKFMVQECIANGEANTIVFREHEVEIYSSVNSKGLVFFAGRLSGKAF